MKRSLHLVLVSLLACNASWSARPLVSDTADSLAKRECEWETAVASARISGAPNVRVFDTLVACGVGGGTQFSAGFTRATGGGNSAQAMALAGKTNFVEPKDGRTGWGLAYGVAFDKLPGTGWRHGGTRLLGVATRTLGDHLTGHANLGWVRDEADKSSSATWSLGLEGNGPARWTADVFGDDRGKPWVSAGVLWPLTEKFNINLAVAQSSDAPRTRLWTLAFKLDF